MSNKCDECGKSYSDKNSLRHLHYNKLPSHAPDHWDQCPECNKKYESIGAHWSHSRSHIPEYTEKQKDIVTGILMGDGCLRREKYPRMELSNINKKYLEYIKSEFGILCGDVRLKCTAKESCENAIKGGLNKNAKEENYSDVYSITFRKSKSLEQFVDWYDSGSKSFPNNIELNSTILKHWYICDGSLIQGSRGRPHMVIVASNEIDNKEKILSMFNNIGFNISNFTDKDIVFGVDESERLWNYMGQPVDGFKYKWPDN